MRRWPCGGTSTRTYAAAGQQQDRSPGNNGALRSSGASACGPEPARPLSAATARAGGPNAPERIRPACAAPAVSVGGIGTGHDGLWSHRGLGAGVLRRRPAAPAGTPVAVVMQGAPSPAPAPCGIASAG